MQPHDECARRRPRRPRARQVLALCAGVLTVLASSPSEAATFTCAGGDVACLRAGNRERYRFTIGVPEPAAITFFVNVLGERTVGRCALRKGSADDSGAVDPDPD